MECEGMTLRPASIGLILAALLVFASCSSESAPIPISAGSESSLSSSRSSTIADPLDGTAWRSTYTCDDARKNLEEAGFHNHIPKDLRDCPTRQPADPGLSGLLFR